mmetsp:Transcript_2178/g.6482  ORF Transcript_2178/g.6482 Transcript_2178/m.6482 type:complete len:219 (+) Transcript_2178:200-856(+)
MSFGFVNFCGVRGVRPGLAQRTRSVCFCRMHEESTTAPTIYPMILPDIMAVADLRSRVFGGPMGEIQRRRELYQVILTRMRYGNIATYVVKSDEVVVGTGDGALYSTAGDRIQLRNAAVMKQRKLLYISGMSVDRNFRRRGIGSMLLKQLFALAKELNVPEVVLHVERDNQPARKMYQAWGFQARPANAQMAWIDDGTLPSEILLSSTAHLDPESCSS